MLKLKQFIVVFILINSFVYPQSDPNNDPNWNWLVGQTWTLYPSGYPLGTYLQPNNPFY
jgi:hypothetical protein